MSNILYTNFHREEGGGHTTYILSLLKNQKHNKFVACPPTSMLYKTLQNQGCDTLIPVEFPGKLKQYRAIVKNTLALRKAILKHNIDIIHTNGSSDNRMALYASLFCEKKFNVVFTKHNTIKINNAISRLRLRKFNDAVIFVGHFLDNLGLDKNCPSFHVIENGVDLEYWKKRESAIMTNSSAFFPLSYPAFTFWRPTTVLLGNPEFLVFGLYCDKTRVRIYIVQMDSVSPEKRSWVMAQVKGRNTKPEKAVRSLLHRMGCRFRLQRRDLPGKPDIVLPRFKTALFVHGCFWHRHPDCKRATTPTSNTDYWNTKFSRTVARDAKNQKELEALGWRVLIVWECELKDIKALQDKIESFLPHH